MKPAIVVHSGIVGALFDKRVKIEKFDEYIGYVKDATQKGMDILKQGGSSLDAVEIAITTLEDNPFNNSGTGSYLTIDGEAEMDASIMDGKTLACGAVGAISDVQNPISVARKVMDKSGHVLLVGEGATKFAREMGFPEYDPKTKENIARWKYYHEKIGTDIGFPWRDYEKLRKKHPELMHDTSGAVAIDSHGNITAGTSAGGTFFRLPGRIGDIPLIGCGTYADNTSGGVSVTGIGEVMVKLTMAKTCAEYMESGFTAKTALAAGLDLVEQYMKKYRMKTAAAGLVGIDAQGRVGVAYNSPNMMWAYIKESEEMQCADSEMMKGLIGD
jgi:beta-aspartyl-peptidase (threonine type)